jgi:hypothetical protein
MKAVVTMLGRRFFVRQLIGFAASAALLALAGSASATPPPPPSFQDSVVESGSGGLFSSVEVNIVSGPSGENPTGTVAAVYTGTDPPTTFTATSVICLSVTGNQATFVVALAPGTGSNFGKVTVVDNGTPGAGLDTSQVEGTLTQPDCSPLETTGPLALGAGDIAVHDGSLPPTFMDQCKNGGWATLGFRNQGQCVAYVQRGPKP